MGTRVHADAGHTFNNARLQLRGVHKIKAAVRDFWVGLTALPPSRVDPPGRKEKKLGPPAPRAKLFRVRGGRPQPSKHRKLLTTPLPLSKSLLQLAKLSGQLHPGTGRAVQFTGGQHPPQILDKQRVVRLTI